jgi:hypothetical protein
VIHEKPMRTDYLRHQSVGQLLALLAEAESSRGSGREAVPDDPGRQVKVRGQAV